MLPMMIAGCAPDRVSEDAVLKSLSKPMCSLAAGVVADGGPESKRAARNVIAIYDAGVLDKRLSEC